MPRRRYPFPLALALALVVPFTLLALTQGVAALEFEEEPTSISGDEPETQTGVVMAAGPEDLLYAVWEDGRWTPFQQGVAIVFAWSEPDHRGREWSDEVRLPLGDARNDATAPAISVGPDGVIHVAWQELQVVDAPAGGPYWEVRYASSDDNGLTWESLRVSQPNNRNNTRPSLVGIAGDSAFVAWDLEDHPGSSIALARIDQGSRAWIREDFAEASVDWEVNGHVSLEMDGDGDLHAAWHAMDMDGMWEVQRSQVLYREMTQPTRDTVLTEPTAIADRWTNLTNSGPQLVVTRRNGVWIAWVQTSPPSMGKDTMFLADQVLEGVPGTDILVSQADSAAGTTATVAASHGPDDGVVLAMAGVGMPAAPPLVTSTCSELGCFDDVAPAVPPGASAGVRATVAIDSLDNVYVGWDDGSDVWCTQRRNSPPGRPELLSPTSATNDELVEFVWSFNDVDAGASQSSFEIMYSLDPTFPTDSTLGGVVMGAKGRSNRYAAPEPIAQGRWYWRVSTRDQLGLWSNPSPSGDFLADRTPPVGSVLINGGDGFTTDRVVVLTLNASDNLEDLGGEMFFQISSDPNFPNASRHDWPPPNHQVNQELPPGEGIKTVFFRIFDATDLQHTSMDNIVYNTTPFLIVHVPVTSAPLGKDLNISCDIMRVTDVAATLFYKKSYEDEYREVEMDSNGTSFWAEIPKAHVSILGMEYYIKARSSGGYVTSPTDNPADEPFEVEVFETTEVYQPPIYNPLFTFTGAVIVLLALVLIWYYRLREGPTS
jgi:hypothetical protein